MDYLGCVFTVITKNCFSHLPVINQWQVEPNIGYNHEKTQFVHISKEVKKHLKGSKKTQKKTIKIRCVFSRLSTISVSVEQTIGKSLVNGSVPGKSVSRGLCPPYGEWTWAEGGWFKRRGAIRRSLYTVCHRRDTISCHNENSYRAKFHDFAYRRILRLRSPFSAYRQAPNFSASCVSVECLVTRYYARAQVKNPH